VLKLLLAAVLGMWVGVQSDGPSSQTTVRVRVERAGTRRTYCYVVRNGRRETISSIFIGTAEGIDEPELASPPLGWRPEANDCPRSIVVPDGWTGCVGRQEESAKLFLRLEAVQPRAELAPGGSLEFTVTVGRRDATYEAAVFWAIRSTGAADIGRVASAQMRR